MSLKSIYSSIFFLFFYASMSYAQLHVCTVATKNTSGFENLKKSCKSVGLRLTALGMGEEYSGNYVKLIWTKKFISTLAKDDILLFIDGYDVIILADEQEILDKFTEMNAQFIIGAEPVLYPSKHRILVNYPESPTKFRYINSGCYIGYVSAIEEILDDLIAHYPSYKSDQKRTHEHFLRNKEKYTLDYHCNLFLNLSRVPSRHLYIDFENKRIFHKPTNTLPIAAHGCGLRKKYIIELGQKLFGSIN